MTSENFPGNLHSLDPPVIAESVASSTPSGSPSPSPPPPSRKRASGDSYDGPIKRSRRGPAKSSPSTGQPRYVIVHLVTCQRHNNHVRHQRSAYFLDIPRLFAGDSKASALRGTHDLSNLKEYLEDHPEVSFIIYKSYNCERYHETIQDQFERLQIPKIDSEVVAQLRPYLFTLKKDEEPALADSERMEIISDELQEVMEVIEADPSDAFTNRHDGHNLRAPHLHFYHYRPLMVQYASESPSQIHREHIKLLLDYLNSSHGSEYEEADALFRRGMVSKLHFSKMFGPNEVIVTVRNDQPLAFVSRKCPIAQNDPLELDCWSWSFDGVFRRQTSPVRVDWPASSSAIIPISALKTYPLRFDTSGLEQRLRKRGRTFWECRERKFVSYESPKPSFEVQVVRLPTCCSLVSVKLIILR